MTLDEAKAILQDPGVGYIGWEDWEFDGRHVVLDGCFTLPQLEAIVTVMRHDADHWNPRSDKADITLSEERKA